MRDYKNIKAYQLADKATLEVYRITQYFPKEEVYGLTSQLRRAAVSVPTNIAEGASRQHKKDYLNFLFIARGSISEFEYLLILSKRLAYLSNKDFEHVEKLRLEAAKALFGLINSVAREVGL